VRQGRGFNFAPLATDVDLITVPARGNPLGLVQMKPDQTQLEQADALVWAQQLTLRVSRVLAAYPDADPDNVRHTLILLDKPPLERLQRSLIRGRATSIR